MKNSFMEQKEYEIRWNKVKDNMVVDDIYLNHKFAYFFKHSPDKILSYLSLYKFAAKMIGKNKRVLDIGCMEGLGTWLLAFECGYAKGIDSDEDSIKTAEKNFNDSRVSYEQVDLSTTYKKLPSLSLDNNLSSLHYDQWDAVVNFDALDNTDYDAVENINDSIDNLMLIASNLINFNGIAIIGIDNTNSKIMSDNFKNIIYKYFEHTFFFTALGENILIRFDNSSQYIIVLCCKKR